jgi:hypothetical protein
LSFDANMEGLVAAAQKLDALRIRVVDRAAQTAIGVDIRAIKERIDATIRKAEEAIRVSEYSIERFITEEIIEEPDAREDVGVIYGRYCQWSKGSETPISLVKFALDFLTFGFKKKRVSHTTYYYGVRLRTPKDLIKRLDGEVAEIDGMIYVMRPNPAFNIKYYEEVEKILHTQCRSSLDRSFIEGEVLYKKLVSKLSYDEFMNGIPALAYQLPKSARYRKGELGKPFLPYL